MSCISFPSASRVQNPGTIYDHEHSIPIKVLVDSSADYNFIDSDFVKSHGIPTYELATPEDAHLVDGKLLLNR